MTDDNRYAHYQLNAAAYALAQELLDGRWSPTDDLIPNPSGERESMIGELERRCPGFSRRYYERAVSRGLFETHR
jgi:hypothetical protein